MTATLSWVQGEETAISANDLHRVLAEAAQGTNEPTIAVLRAEGAELHAVLGDLTGTVLLYYPADYAEAGVGSLQSVGDSGAAQVNAWEPPLTAYYFGHHTELPRWAVVPHDLGERALKQFCDEPLQPPTAVAWKAD